MDKPGNDHIEKYFQNLHACDALTKCNVHLRIPWQSFKMP